MGRKLAAPVLLVVTGICILIGCIPIPGNFKMPGDQPRPESQIGDLASDKPLKVRGATPSQVTEHLGPPALASRDGSIVVYSYMINDSSVFWPLCFFSSADRVTEQYNPRHLLLRFGPDARLQSFKTYKDLSQLRRDTSWTPLEPVAPPRERQKY
jgi:hypothetical protein